MGRRPNFVQVGLRGYWPEKATFDWMAEQGFRWHTIVDVEERGVDAVIDDAIAEALDGPDLVYLSVDIDVVDPGMALNGTPEPGGMSARELLRAIRRSRVPSISPGWTWRCRRRTTRARSRRCSPIVWSWRRSCVGRPARLTMVDREHFEELGMEGGLDCPRGCTNASRTSS